MVFVSSHGSANCESTIFIFRSLADSTKMPPASISHFVVRLTLRGFLPKQHLINIGGSPSAFAAFFMARKKDQLPCIFLV